MEERLGLDVISLLDTLAIGRVSFWGLSIDGMIGMWLGANDRERIEWLALCSTLAHMLPERFNAVVGEFLPARRFTLNLIIPCSSLQGSEKTPRRTTAGPEGQKAVDSP